MFVYTTMTYAESKVSLFLHSCNIANKSGSSGGAAGTPTSLAMTRRGTLAAGILASAEKTANECFIPAHCM